MAEDLVRVHMIVLVEGWSPMERLGIPENSLWSMSSHFGGAWLSAWSLENQFNL